MGATEIVTIETKVQQFASVSILVHDQASLDAAGRFLKESVLPLKKEIEETFGPIKQKQRAAWQEAIDQEKRHLEPVLALEKAIRWRMAVYLSEEEQRRLEAAKAAEGIAREKAERERAERLELEAEFGASDEELAEIAAEPVITELPSEPPKAVAAGFNTRTTWKGEVTSKIELIKHVAANPGLQYLLDVNMPFLNSLARNDKEEFNLPGAKAVSEKGVSTRG